jgi:hypothetical protein
MRIVSLSACLNLVENLALGNELAGMRSGRVRPTPCRRLSSLARPLAAPELPELLGEELLAVGVGVQQADKVRHGLLGKGFGELGSLGAAHFCRVAHVLLKQGECHRFLQESPGAAHFCRVAHVLLKQGDCFRFLQESPGAAHLILLQG